MDYFYGEERPYPDSYDMAQYLRNWGSLGASSNTPFERKSIFDPDYTWSWLDEAQSERDFAFHKYLQARDIQISAPKFVNLAALDEYYIFYSHEPRFDHGSGEIRLFIPFVDGDSIMIGGEKVAVPRDAQSSSNFSTRREGGAVDRSDTEDRPGFCLVFHPISTNIPHDSTPMITDDDEMDGAPMSSLRNTRIREHNRLHRQDAPLFHVDWGYEGYWETDLYDIFNDDEMLAPLEFPGTNLGYAISYAIKSPWQNDVAWILNWTTGEPLGVRILHRGPGPFDSGNRSRELMDSLLQGAGQVSRGTGP